MPPPPPLVPYLNSSRWHICWISFFVCHEFLTSCQCRQPAATIISLLNINNVKTPHRMCPRKICWVGKRYDRREKMGCTRERVCSGHTPVCSHLLLSDNQFGIRDQSSLFFHLIEYLRSLQEVKIGDNSDQQNKEGDEDTCVCRHGSEPQTQSLLLPLGGVEGSRSLLFLTSPMLRCWGSQIWIY